MSFGTGFEISPPHVPPGRAGLNPPQGLPIPERWLLRPMSCRPPVPRSSCPSLAPSLPPEEAWPYEGTQKAVPLGRKWARSQAALGRKQAGGREGGSGRGEPATAPQPGCQRPPQQEPVIVPHAFLGCYNQTDRAPGVTGFVTSR